MLCLCFTPASPLLIYVTAVILLYLHLFIYTPILLVLYSYFSWCVFVCVCVCIYMCTLFLLFMLYLLWNSTRVYMGRGHTRPLIFARRLCCRTSVVHAALL